jgi:hypothetical protein
VRGSSGGGGVPLLPPTVPPIIILIKRQSGGEREKKGQGAVSFHRNPLLFSLTKSLTQLHHHHACCCFPSLSWLNNWLILLLLPPPSSGPPVLSFATVPSRRLCFVPCCWPLPKICYQIRLLCDQIKDLAATVGKRKKASESRETISILDSSR